MPSVFATLIGTIGALVVAIGGYTVARLSNSGRITTTTAATLWSESTAMRNELRGQVKTLSDEIARLNSAGDDRDRIIADLRARLAEAERRLVILQYKIDSLGVPQ